MGMKMDDAPLIALLASTLMAGCGSCGKSSGPKSSAKAESTAKTAQAASVSGMAYAVQVGSKAYLWTSGRNGAIGHAVDALSWSDDGFELADKGGAQVLAPGGGAYWRFSEARSSRTPLKELLTADATAPEGHSAGVTVGRGGQYLVSVSAPGTRRVRMGTFREEPVASAWLEGALPTGRTASGQLAAADGWPGSAETGWTHGIPANTEALTLAEVSAEDLSAALKRIGKLRGGGVKIAFSGRIDLDQDGGPEDLICVTGGSGDYGCFMAADFDGEARTYGLNMPYKKGDTAAEPLAFRTSDGVYVVWTGKPARGGDTSPDVHHLTRWNGAGYVTEVVR